MPKVFISHSREDNAISRKLAENLMRDGAEVWIDYTKIEGGDSLPKVISNAIDWCDTLILIWSGSATGSYWVEEEWTCAHSLRKRIIPCLIDDAKLPSILRSKLNIHFADFELGYISLARTLKIKIKDIEEKHKTLSESESKELERGAKSNLPDKKKPYLHKKEWYKPVGITFVFVCLVVIGITQFDLLNDDNNEKLADNTINEISSNTSKINLRSTPKVLTEHEVNRILTNKNLFESDWNKYSNGFANNYELMNKRGQEVVYDHASGLVWQQDGSSNSIMYEDAKNWINDLNLKGFAGYSDWRLPTLEEAMSLMESEKKNDDLYIDSIFEAKQYLIWTSDMVKGESWAWLVNFGSGSCGFGRLFGLGDLYYVRAVRSIK